MVWIVGVNVGVPGPGAAAFGQLSTSRMDRDSFARMRDNLRQRKRITTLRCTQQRDATLIPQTLHRSSRT